MFDLRAEPIEQLYSVLQQYEVPVENVVLEEVSDLRFNWEKVQQMAGRVMANLTSQKDKYFAELQSMQSKLVTEIKEFLSEYRSKGPAVAGIGPRVCHLCLHFYLY